MNRKNIERAINVMSRTNERDFSMRNWFCGSQACFAGTLALSGKGKRMGLRVRYGPAKKRRLGIYVKRRSDGTILYNSDAIAHVLGIRRRDAISLCGYSSAFYAMHGMSFAHRVDKVKPEHIIKLLNVLLEHGELT